MLLLLPVLVRTPARLLSTLVATASCPDWLGAVQLDVLHMGAACGARTHPSRGPGWQLGLWGQGLCLLHQVAVMPQAVLLGLVSLLLLERLLPPAGERWCRL